MIRNTTSYRITADRSTRRISIQDGVTWRVLSALEIPQEDGVLDAVREGIAEIDGTEPPKPAAPEPETPVEPEPEPTAKPAKKNKN